MNEEEKQMRLQVLEQQAAEVHARIHELENAINEVRMVSDSLKELKKNASMLSHVGAGVYLKTRLEDENTVILSLGDGIMAQYDVQTAMQKLNDMVKKLEEELQKQNEVYKNLGMEYARLTGQTG